MNTRIRIQKEHTHIFSPSIHIAVLGTIAGKVSDQVLGEAVTKAVTSHEILSCKITLDEQGQAYYERIEQPLVRIESFTGDWVTVVQEQETMAFDWANGELIRFFVKRQQDSFQLLIVAHHLAGDGLAVFYLLDDVVQALNGHDLIEQPLQLYDPTPILAKSKLSLGMRFMLRGLNRKWQKTGQSFTYADYQEMFQRYWQNRKTEILCEELDEAQLSALKQRAKQQGITLNSLLTAAFAQAAQAPSDIGLAASIRPPTYRGMGNYATGISIRYRYTDAKDFERNAQAIHKLIYAKLENPKKKFFLLHFMNEVAPTLIDAAYFSAYGGYTNKTAQTVRNLFGYGGKPKSISITNLTTLDLNQQEGKYSLTAVQFVPPLVPNARRIIGICTYRERMSITLHVEHNDQLAEEKAFFEAAMRELRKQAG